MLKHFKPEKTKELIETINDVRNINRLAFKKRVENLIQEGADPNAKGKDGLGLLAIEISNTENTLEAKNNLCEFILKNKLDVNAKLGKFYVISLCLLKNKDFAASALIEMGFNHLPDKENKSQPYFYNEFLIYKVNIDINTFGEIIKRGLDWKKQREMLYPSGIKQSNIDNELLALKAHQQLLLDAKQIKFLGHKFGLGGSIHFETENYKIPKMKLEACNIAHTLPEVKNSLDAFVECHQKPDTQQEVLKLIQETYERAVLPHKNKSNANFISTAKAYKEGKPVIFDSKWENHSTMTILYKDRLYLCDKDSSKPIKCYKIGNVEPLLSDDETVAQKFYQFSTKIRKEYSINSRFGLSIPILGEIPFMRSDFTEPKMMKELELSKVKEITLKRQKVGNCSYTNTKRGIYGLMLALIDRDAQDKKEKSKEQEIYKKKKWPESWKKIQSIDVSTLNHDAFEKLYHEFALHDRLRCLDDYFKRLDELCVNGVLPKDNNSYIEPLIRILHDQYDAHSPMNKTCGKKILQKLRSIGFTDKEIAKRVYSSPDNVGIIRIIKDMTIGRLQRFNFLKAIGLYKNESPPSEQPKPSHLPNKSLHIPTSSTQFKDNISFNESSLTKKRTRNENVLIQSFLPTSAPFNSTYKSGNSFTFLAPRKKGTCG